MQPICCLVTQDDYELMQPCSMLYQTTPHAKPASERVLAVRARLSLCAWALAASCCHLWEAVDNFYEFSFSHT